MAYDGKIMRRAMARLEADRQVRENAFLRRTEQAYAREPRLREIEAELCATMSHIITSALRRGTDPRPAVAVLRDRNLSLQAERTRLLANLGLPADYLDRKPKCPLCGDTGFRGEAVCSCLRGYYAQAQKEELSRMLDLAEQSFDSFSLDWYSEKVDPEYGISPGKIWRRCMRSVPTTPIPSDAAAGTCCCSARRDWARPSSPPPSPGR